MKHTGRRSRTVHRDVGSAPAPNTQTGGYTVVNLPSGKRVRVPVDKGGNVDLRRLSAIMDIDDKKSVHDYDERADKVLPVDCTPRQAAAWIASTDNVDIEGLDVKGSPLRNYGDRTGDNLEVHRKIDVYALPDQEKQIRDTIDSAFTLEDRRKLVGKGIMEVESRPLKSGVLGTHCEDNISLKRGRGVKNSVVVHEGVHHLRQVDKDRESPVVKTFDFKDVQYSGRSTDPGAITRYKMAEASNVEESCTVAESMARQKDFDVSGYYYSVQVFDPKTHRYRNPTPAEAERMAEEDRKLFTEGGKPLAGREAVRSVERHWADSNIARLKLGRSMAINTMARCKPSSGVKPITNSKSPKKSKPAKSGPAAKKTPAGRTGTSSAKSPRQTVLFSRSAKRKTKGGKRKC